MRVSKIVTLKIKIKIKIKKLMLFERMAGFTV
jgi:hypothetical protein